MTIYNIQQVQDFLNTIDKTEIITSKKKIYYNIPVSFDIETSSFYEDKNGVIYTNDDYKKLKNKVIAEKKGKNYSVQNLSTKLKKGTINFNEINIILEKMGYEIVFKKQ